MAGESFEGVFMHATISIEKLLAAEQSRHDWLAVLKSNSPYGKRKTKRKIKQIEAEIDDIEYIKDTLTEQRDRLEIGRRVLDECQPNDALQRPGREARERRLKWIEDKATFLEGA